MKCERLGRPVVVGDLTITPVERVELRVAALGHGVVASASKRAVALLLRTRARTWRIELPQGDG